MSDDDANNDSWNFTKAFEQIRIEHQEQTQKLTGRKRSTYKHHLMWHSNRNPCNFSTLTKNFLLASFI